MMYSFPPGPKGLPILGVSLDFRKDPLQFFSQLERDFGPLATVQIRDFKLVFASRASSVRHVLIENAQNFTNREAYLGLVPLLGDGLLTIDGDFHKKQRRLVMPAFHRQRVENYGNLMISSTLETLDRWQPGQRVDMAEEMQWLTLRIVAKALFNVDLSEESSQLGQAFIHTAEYLNQARRFSIGSIPINLPFTKYGRFKRSKAILDQKVYKIIQDHRNSSQDYGDVLSMLFHAQDEDGSTLTDVQIHDETMTFLAAGHATTANALTWTFYLLSQHPEVHQKLMDEIRDVLGDRTAALTDLEDLPYLEMVVKESMRLFPPAWAVMRRATHDFELESRRLPGGTFVSLSPYVTHRLPQYWSHPDRFWPERFGPDHKEPNESFAYFPFGAGPRTCIGMPFAMQEARMLLATILQRFTPEMVPNAKVEPQPLITLRPRYGLPMILKSTPTIYNPDHRSRKSLLAAR